MPKHPTVEVPNIGSMDHAWDVLGDWTVDFEVPFHTDAVYGVLSVRSWMEAELELDPWGAAAAGLPEKVVLERASRVPRTSRRITATQSRRGCWSSVTGLFADTRTQRKKK